MITSVWVQIQTVHDYKHDSSHYTFPLSSPVGPAFNTIFTHSRNPKIEDTSLFPTQLKRRRRKCWLLSCVWLFVNTGTVTHHAPLSMVFSQQEYWTGVPLPSPGNFPNYLSVALKSERIKQEAKVWCAFSLPLLGGIQLFFKWHRDDPFTFFHFLGQRVFYNIWSNHVNVSRQVLHYACNSCCWCIKVHQEVPAIK